MKYLQTMVYYAAVLIKFTYYAQIMLKNKNCAQSIINIYIQVCINRSLLIADNL